MKENCMPLSEIGVIGLSTMGRNLVLNMLRHDLSVVAYNRTPKRTHALISACSSPSRIRAAYHLRELVEALAPPRQVLMMIQAGAATDAVISQVLPMLSPGDVLLDGGNAHYRDTDRRCAAAAERGVHYLGIGVSGGEKGARLGPSLMAGGAREGYAIAGSSLEAIAASGPQGVCCAYLGPGSAGHYVKMVHNGIEYALMQALCEAYDIMHRGLGLSIEQSADVFARWNGTLLESYLVGITETVLRQEDPETGRPLLESIRDTASQKGTGRWSTQSALDLGAPAPTIAAAVLARIISSLKEERVAAQALLAAPSPAIKASREQALEGLFSAVLCTFLSAYSQGFRQLKDASLVHGYGLELAEVARIWMAGCIIRARLLVPMAEALRRDTEVPLLMAAEPFRSLWGQHHDAFRRCVASAHIAGIPVPAMSSALDFMDAYRTGRLPANLLQAQRDLFGAHSYQRTDREGDFHTQWEASS
jgi:6-phosphogluconate dehydrogenase